MCATPRSKSTCHGISRRYRPCDHPPPCNHPVNHSDALEFYRDAVAPWRSTVLKYPERSNDYEGELEDGTCAQLLSWPGGAAYKRARRDRRRDDGLPRLRHVRARDEPSILHVPANHRRRRGNPAPSAEHPRQLPCPVFAGRRHAAVCGHPHEPHAPPAAPATS